MLKYKNILVITVAVLVSLTVSIPSGAHNVASLGIDDLFLNVRKDQPASLVFRFTPSAYDLSKESELILEPVIESRDLLNMKSLPKIVVAGKNRLIRYERGLSRMSENSSVYSAGDINRVSYNATFQYEPWMESCTLSIVMSLRGCCGKQREEATVPVAKVAFDDARFAAPALRVDFGATDKTKREPKIRDLQGTAYIDYKVNHTDIDPNYRRNTEELAKILSVINVVKDDPDAIVTDIFVKGFASPDGKYSGNARLAAGRTEALKEYVKGKCHFPEDLFHLSSEPEDWSSLRDSIAASSLAGKGDMLRLIDSDLAPDDKELKLKLGFPQQYKSIREKIYPALRRSDYVIRYKIKEYEEAEEIRDVLETRPDHLNDIEFLSLLTTYTPGTPVYDETLEKGLKLFPDNPQICYLKGVDLAQKGDFESAVSFLNKASRLGITEADAALESIRQVTSDKDPVEYLQDSGSFGILKAYGKSRN